MKKLTAIICVVAILFSFATTAFASDWDVLFQNYKSYDATVEFSIQINKPLKCIEVFNEDAGFDVKSFIEELAKAKYVASVQAELADDVKSGKIAMSINADVPVKLSEDLKLGADITLYMWMEYDFTSTENAKFDIVVKNPLTGEYIVIDYFEIMDMNGVSMSEEMFEVMENTDTKSIYEDIMNMTKALYEKHAELKKNGSEYTITFTNNGIIDLIFDYMAGFSQAGIDTEIDFGEIEMETVKAMAKGLGVFGENDAFVMKVKTDRLGKIAEATESVHFDFNICEVADALGYGEYINVMFAKEMGDIDITLNSKATYEKINEKNIVNMPVITEENSVSLMELMGYSDIEPDYEYDYQFEEFWVGAKGMLDNGNIYVDLTDFLDGAYFDSDNLEGVVEVNGDDVTLTLKSDIFDMVEIKGSLNDKGYTLSGYELGNSVPFIMKNEYNIYEEVYEDRLYIDIDVLTCVLDAKVESLTVYFMDMYGNELEEPEYQLYIVRPNFGYVPTEDEFDIIGGADEATEILLVE